MYCMPWGSPVKDQNLLYCFASCSISDLYDNLTSVAFSALPSDGTGECSHQHMRRYPEVDPEFWSGGPSGVLTPEGIPEFAKNRVFSLKIAWRLNDFKNVFGAPGPQSPWTHLWHPRDGSTNVLNRWPLQMTQLCGSLTLQDFPVRSY